MEPGDNFDWLDDNWRIKRVHDQLPKPHGETKGGRKRNLPEGLVVIQAGPLWVVIHRTVQRMRRKKHKTGEFIDWEQRVVAIRSSEAAAEKLARAARG